jgi:hypothetical protein
MKLNLKFAVAAVGLLSSAAGFSAQSLDELKERCAFLESEVSQGQARPFTIDIECQRTRTFWGQEKTTMSLPQIATYIGSANIKGRYRVDAESVSNNHMGVQDCHLYREYTVTTVPETVRLQSCSELAGLTSIAQFCATRQPSETEAAPVEQEAQATGKVLSSCVGAPQSSRIRR